jgi:hypothetical protein
LMPLILALGTLSHRLIWMVMMVMLDLNFPFFFRDWEWKSDEYGVLINEEFLSFCHWNYRSKRKVDQRWLAFLIRDLDVTFLTLYLQQLQNRCHSTDVWWVCACALSLQRACTRTHPHTHTHTHTQRDAEPRTCYSSKTGAVSPLCVQLCFVEYHTLKIFCLKTGVLQTMDYERFFM